MQLLASWHACWSQRKMSVSNSEFSSAVLLLACRAYVAGSLLAPTSSLGLPSNVILRLQRVNEPSNKVK